MHLEGGLGAVEDQRHPARRARRGAEERDRLFGDASGVADEIHLLDGLVAGAELVPPEAVGMAAHLHLVGARRRGVHAAPGLPDELLDPGALRAREVTVLPDELERGPMAGDPRHGRHRLVGADEQVHLLLEADLERVSPLRRDIPTGGRHRRRQPHPAAAEAGRGPGDADRQASAILEGRGVHPVDAREPPGAVDESAHPDSFVLEGRDVGDGGVLDSQRLRLTLHHPAVGVRRTSGSRGIQHEVGDLSH